MAKVSVQNVSKTYAEKGREVAALRDFCLEVADREFVVLVGPSGCGKSAALRMIAGLEETTSGEIRIGEKLVNGMAPGDRDIAMVSQHDALYPDMSVYENMAFGLKLRKFPQGEIKRRVTEAAGILGIEQSLEKKPGKLSGEERQRAALGRAIARQPKVFLFDEPLSSLDGRARAGMRAEISRLHHRLQATMIYATHDHVEAMTMGDRIVVMKEGVIQQSGTPLTVYREPENLFVAGFLGNPPMNCIAGKLRESGDALIFKEAGEGVIEIKLTGRAGAKACAGREVVAAVRPEDIQIVSGTAKPGGARCKALLDVIEQMGGEAHIHIETGAHRVIARTESSIGNDEAGHRVQFEIDPARVLLFDPETSRRIPA